ncbi:MAG: bifunctional proline dehydrogenase/L-glutamate gamma-semialdehyde dehydrogenase PutA [Alphaproteobacteria bacterium]
MDTDVLRHRRAVIAGAYRQDETAAVSELLPLARLTPAEREAAEALARQLVEGVRADADSHGGLDAFLAEYGLETREGVVLMCLAEALLRIPDADTADRLIRDKLSDADWEDHLGHSGSLLVNASTWGLMLSGEVIGLDRRDIGAVGGFLGRLVAKSGEPLIRQAMRQAMRIMGRQFVLGRTIEEAISEIDDAYDYSFDMLGEAARTHADADRYFAAYRNAIDTVGAKLPGGAMSIKLSALHPRYEYAQGDRVMAELVPRLAELVERGRQLDVAIAIDAEEADRLEPSLDVFEAVLARESLAGWSGFGMVVQAYQKRAPHVIEWLAALAEAHDRLIPVRLVKGAYWDSEIKWAQELGLDGYPVFTRKTATDVSYIACAKALFAADGRLFPQFATHNAYTLAAVKALAGNRTGYEFQRLHGMGAALYGQVVGEGGIGPACRVYAPVGSHEDLLPYLVRRLLENGANTSFVNRLAEADVPVDALVEDPVAIAAGWRRAPHPKIPLPRDLFGGVRRNARGVDLASPLARDLLYDNLNAAIDGEWTAAPIVGGEVVGEPNAERFDPSRRDRRIGHVADADAKLAGRAVELAVSAQIDWDRRGGAARAAILERAADLYEQSTSTLLARVIREGGRTVRDAVSELREAVDFLRYYAAQARAHFAAPITLPGPTGEANTLALAGRGVFVCISPWNFPLAIFTGQIAGALAAGNAVIAKPAEQTPLVAAAAIRLLHRAGVPGEVLHLLTGPGESVGAALVGDPRIAGVAFTGSTATAQRINRTLAARDGPLATLIAETGGQNAMIVDSSALTEQVVADAVLSAFNSAGQRCSAARVLFVQDSVAERTIEMLAGAMAELRLGDPLDLATDVGPLIDDDARAGIEAHLERIKDIGRVHAIAPLDELPGSFLAPRLIEIDRLDRLAEEVFGPVLHVIRYRGDRLGKVCEAINATGYGLTLGVHSRVDDTVAYIQARVRVGNMYVNRNQVGAVVGVQPFGGEGLSGTGPKAGGPHYLPRFAVERSVSINTAAAGGNTALMALDEER